MKIHVWKISPMINNLQLRYDRNICNIRNIFDGNLSKSLPNRYISLRAGCYNKILSF